MTNEEKIEKFKKMTKEELRKIARDPYANESDMIIASIELGHRDIAEGNVYTTEEVLEHVLGRNNMANKSRRGLTANL